MRKAPLALLVVLALGTTAFGAEPPRHRREERGSFQRIVHILKKVFSVSSNSDELIAPRP